MWLKFSRLEARRLGFEVGLMGGMGLVLALAVYGCGLDAWLARRLYVPDARWAWAVRQWAGPLLGGAVLLAGLLVLPQGRKWAQKHRDIHQTVAVLVLAVVLGAGLLNQVVVQGLADRVRPRDSVLAAAPAAIGMARQEGLHGNAMPSGHAAMGFAFVAPYFLLRRRRPAAARGFLAAGSAAGLFIGYARMVMGAHFLSDVLVAGVIALVAGALLAVLVAKVGYIRRRWWAAGLLAALLALVLGNHFKVTLTRELGPEFVHTDLPCPLQVVEEPGLARPMLTVTVDGYGAPVSQVQLEEKQGLVRLRRWRGIYPVLRCTALMRVGAVSYD
jgi:membrane-associated PAP2 superfamily phosphatase